jgi:hypothetical protein
MFTDSKAIVTANMSLVDSVMSNPLFSVIGVAYHRLNALSSLHALGVSCLVGTRTRYLSTLWLGVILLVVRVYVDAR